MGDLQHFCLRWNNYQSSITSAFENLRDDEDFVDVTLACEGKSLKAHRVVLSACSPYFRELLKSTPCKHPVIVLQDVVFEDLHALVEFIYHGEVNVHQQSLSSFLKTAEVLRVSGLTQQAEASGISEKWWREGAAEERGGSPSHLLPRPGRPPLTSQHHRVSMHRERERPSSAGEVNEQLQQENAMPNKRQKMSISEQQMNHTNTNNNNNNNQQTQQASTLGPNQTGETIKQDPTDSDNEPPMDFSTPTNKQQNKKDTNSISSGDLPSPLSNLVKSEPLDMAACTLNQAENHEDSNDGSVDNISDNGNGNSVQHSQEHDDIIHTSTANSNHHSYLDSKIFAAAGASFNFSMAAALAADSLAGLNNQSHVPGVDGLAGTSQDKTESSLDLRPVKIEMEIPSADDEDAQTEAATIFTGFVEDQTRNRPKAAGGNRLLACNICGKVLSTALTLKRHKQQQHFSPLHSAVCEVCNKVFRTLNSLNNHKSIYHRKQKAGRNSSFGNMGAFS